MDDATTKLALPYILPAQAQKHVTHNEALVILDKLVQLRIERADTNPPATPENGQCYAVAGNAQGEWTGYEEHIATWQDGTWSFIEAKKGFLAWFTEDGALKAYQNGEWENLPLPDQIMTNRLGVGSTPDDYNRFSITSPAVLFNHAGASHQVKINKASASETASLLFQSNWSGRAEMGLAGNDDFSLKICGEDGNWKTALRISGEGVATYPRRPLTLAHRPSGTSTPASGTRSGFSTLAVQQGNIALGSTQAAGGHALTIGEEGTYFISLTLTVSAAAPCSVSVMRNDSTALMVLKSPGGTQTLSASTLATLAAGDSLCLLHSGAMTIEDGPAATALSAFRL